MTIPVNHIDIGTQFKIETELFEHERYIDTRILLQSILKEAPSDHIIEVSKDIWKILRRIGKVNDECRN